MRRLLTPVTLALLLTLSACSSSQRVYEVTEVDRPPEFLGDSLVVEVERERVRYVQPERITPDRAPDRDYDLLTTALDLQFDFADEAVIGTARHTLTPFRDSLDRFYFHAEALDVAAVRQVVNDRGVGVGYVLEDDRLVITPRSPLRYGETYEFVVDYIAHPTRGAGQGSLGDGGRGLYFIDGAGTDPFRPTQVWTQGQAESNRRWFPTWDYPNDRQAFEITLTVPDSMRTAANGTLVEQADLDGGLRRDRWVLDHDQVAYLAAIAVGGWETVRDTVASIDGRLIPLEYIVEPEYADEAQAIFGETPAMVTFFEEYLGVPYPWANYKQVAVRDFTAGGMENTTLSILFEEIQTDDAARLDYSGRDLIAHELAHQWFGDLVTSEDWANLALNESFASYLEALYLEDAFGRDAAQAHGIEDRSRYFAQADTLRRPIVWYGYQEAGAMFDTHTYQKGALVLNQLRFELGDEAFRRGLNRFLTEHAYSTVEVEDLRQAFEAATGQQLRHFFDQWWTEPGHPVLRVEQAYFAGSGLYTVEVVQQQRRTTAPDFDFAVNVEFNYPNAPREVRRIRITDDEQTFRFDVPERPMFVRFNEGNWALTAFTVEQPLAETLAQALQDDELAGRYAAVETLAERDLNAEVREVLVRVATADAHPVVRERAARALRPYAAIPDVAETLRALAREDAAPDVRRAALGVLVPADTSSQTRAVLRAALTDPSAYTRADAVRLFAAHARDEAFAAYEPLLEAPPSYRGRVEAALAESISTYRLGGATGVGYLIARAGVMNPSDVRRAAIKGLVAWSRRDDEVRSSASEALANLLSVGSADDRAAIAAALADVGDNGTLAALERQLATEQDPAVRAALEGAVEQVKKGTTQVGESD